MNNGKPPKLLVIEDDQSSMAILRKVLSAWIPFKGVRTLAEAEATTEDYDAVLLDIGLPDANRETVVDQVKQKFSTAAIVVLSGYENEEYIKRSIMQSASNYLIKGRDDTDGESLAAKIRTAILTNKSVRMIEDFGASI